MYKYIPLYYILHIIIDCLYTCTVVLYIVYLYFYLVMLLNCVTQYLNIWNSFDSSEQQQESKIHNLHVHVV